jgi:hypothetical protein
MNNKRAAEKATAKIPPVNMKRLPTRELFDSSFDKVLITSEGS